MVWGQSAWLASAGAWIGALAWLTSTQLNYSLVPWECDTGWRVTPLIGLALLLVALGGGAVSFNSFRHRNQRLDTGNPQAGTPYEMMAIVGMAASALFGLIILLQGSAALLVLRCAP
ncbi:MAG TPA: hypothetical protein VFE52_10375 [Devosia sp.]|jgi:hypothetical protein|nr:hypothetical protein [Devosia sp.]